jgi:hypothetical protein
MAKKDICPIEAEATRKNHRHPIGVVKARRKVVGTTILAAVASVNVNAKYRLLSAYNNILIICNYIIIQFI